MTHNKESTGKREAGLFLLAVYTCYYFTITIRHCKCLQYGTVEFKGFKMEVKLREIVIEGF